MRIFVLGGAGNMGSEVTRTLLKFSEVEQVAIGEYNIDAANRLAAEIKDPRIRVERVDVTQVKDTAAKLEGFDVLMNTTYFGFFDHAIQVAARAKIDYADLISEPTAEQCELVRQSGITAVSGLGCTPGLSNVLARQGADQFRTTDEVHIHWVSLRTVAPSEGLMDTIIWELATECPTRGYSLNGRFTVVPPFEGSKQVTFAEPVGEQTVYYVPHTETVSLAQNIAGVKYVSVRGTWRPDLMEDFRVLNRYGLLDSAEVQVNGIRQKVSEITRKRIWQTHGQRTDSNLWAFFLNVEVVGERAGRWARYVANVSHPLEWKDRSTAKMTGIPAAVGAMLLGRNKRKQTGIVYPESYYDPAEFLHELARLECIKVEENVTDHQAQVAGAELAGVGAHD
jgi:saccharopine dehydrogenase-like NADP-dependent oxidoreductase